MADVTLRRSRVSGEVRLPPSKSAANRALLAAALSKTPCTVSPIDRSADMEAMLRGVEALGAKAIFENGAVRFAPGARPDAPITVDCGESGSALRFLIPVFAALGAEATFIGRGRLPERPIGLYAELLPAHGAKVETAGGLPLTVSGKLESGVFSLPGNISSQFITGLLFALPLLPGDSEIRLTTALESKGYVDLTRGILAEFGVQVTETETGWLVLGNQNYAAEGLDVEGDWSQASFFLSLAALTGGPVRLLGLRPDSAQGDKRCVELWRKFGLDIVEKDGVYIAENRRIAEPFRGLSGLRIDASQIPDMVPALSVTAAFARGETVIYNAARLRIKESDRLAAMESALSAIGAQVKAAPDGLVILGRETLPGGRAEGRNDHRVVMALAAAGCASEEGVTVTDAESIRKSYPGFFRELHRMGGDLDGVELG